MLRLNYSSMRATLENNYGCIYIGSVAPPPYCSEMDMPDTYRTPEGKYFSVSQPEDNGFYHDFILAMLIEKHELKLISAVYVVNKD